MATKASTDSYNDEASDGLQVIARTVDNKRKPTIFNRL